MDNEMKSEDNSKTDTEEEECVRQPNGSQNDKEISG